MSTVLGGPNASGKIDLAGSRTSQTDSSIWSRRLAEVRAEVVRPGHDAALDGMRGLAVGFVFLVHIYRIVGPIAPEGGGMQFWLRAVASTGQVGVLLFFVLSGFLIYGLVLARRPSYGRFLGRRIQRIYPTFLAVALLYLAICVAWPAVSKLPAGAGAKAEYIARALILLPGLQPQPPLVTVAWTLRYEMAFYLLAGALVFAPPIFRSSRRVRVAFALAALALTLSSTRWIVASMFVFGILAREAYDAVRGVRLPTRGAAWAVALAAGPASVYMFLPELAADYPGMPRFIASAEPVGRYLVLGPVLAAGVALAALGDNPIARFAAWEPVRAFGLISYSYYLSHGIAIHAMERALLPVSLSGYHSLPFAFGMFAVSFVLTVLVALAFFLAIEFPASIRKRIAY